MDKKDLCCPSAVGWCAECGAVVCWLAPEEAALLSGASERLLCCWAEDGMLHLGETEDGYPKICLNSPLLS